MADRNVPGHTQLTRMPSRAYSTAATLASWITAAFVAQYGAEWDHAVRPATEAVSTMEPDRCGRMTPTAALMPLTAPRTLTRNERSQSSVSRLWMRPFGASTPALLIRTSSRPNRSTASATTASTCGASLTSARMVSVGGAGSSRPASVAARDSSDTSLSTSAVSGSAPRRRATAAPERAAGTRDDDDPLRRQSRQSYEQVPSVHVQHRPRHEGRRVRGQELIGPRQIGRRTPATLCRVSGDRRVELGCALPSFGQGGVEPTRRHDVDGDAGGSQVERQGLGQRRSGLPSTSCRRTGPCGDAHRAPIR